MAHLRLLIGLFTVGLAPIWSAEPVHIDFVPALTAPADGYLADHGEGFPSYDRAGLTYGWSASGIPTIARSSALAPDARYRTAAVFQAQADGQVAFWFIRLTNGRYHVHLVAGDPGDPTPNRAYGIKVQGALAIGGAPTQAQPWLDGALDVAVTSNVLLVQQCSGMSDNRICFIDITPLPTDLSASIPAVSSVSPVCIEGTGPAGVPVVASAQGRQLPVESLSDTTYAVNADLSPSAPTAIHVAVDGQPGCSGSIAWAPTALADGSQVVRAGDSLLLKGPPGGLVRVTSSCGTAPAVDIPTSGLVPYAFTKPGFYTLTAEGGTGVLRVTAVAAGMKALACAYGYKRQASIVIEPAGAEDQIQVSANDKYLVAVHRASPDTSANGHVDVTLLPENPGHQQVIARLANGHGILAHRAVDAFELRSSAERYIPVVATYPDGSMLTSAKLTMTPLIRDLSIRMHIFVGGVTFADSTTTMAVSTSDFSATALFGEFPYAMIRAPDGFAKLCHTFVAYQDGVQVSP